MVRRPPSLQASPGATMQAGRPLLDGRSRSRLAERDPAERFLTPLSREGGPDIAFAYAKEYQIGYEVWGLRLG